MWIVMIAPIFVTFLAGVCMLFFAASAKTGCGAAVRLFAGGLLILLAGYCALVIITKLT